MLLVSSEACCTVQVSACGLIRGPVSVQNVTIIIESYSPVAIRYNCL